MSEQPAPAKPVPTITEESRPFWEAAHRHTLALQRCEDCTAYVYYPRPVCPACGGDRLTWHDVSGEGVIYSYTVCHRPAGPAFKPEVPYVVALIDLKEGPRMLSNIVTDDPTQVRIGLPVRVHFEDVTEEVSLPKFRLA